jgi:hypothetical protein
VTVIACIDFADHGYPWSAPIFEEEFFSPHGAISGSDWCFMQE